MRQFSYITTTGMYCSQLHCSELDNDTGPSLQSITEQSALDDFLATAELAGTEFVAGEVVTIVLLLFSIICVCVGCTPGQALVYIYQ